jgi:hypothetical protein
MRYDFLPSHPLYSESRLMLSLVNVISRLIRSHYGSPFTIAYYIKTTAYCYHSVNVITFGLAQSDHIKRLLVYYDEDDHDRRASLFARCWILFLYHLVGKDGK